MSIETILAQIDSEIARLTQVRSLLASTGKVAHPGIKRKPGRPAGKASAKIATQAAGKTKKRRTLSPEARKRIAEAQRKRWAAQKAKK